jgi:hypothetical protein
MSESNIFLEYRGPMNFTVIDSLLKKLKNKKEYTLLNKTTSKRVYAMVVECLENICKHSDFISSDDPERYCHLSLGMEDEKIIIRSGNPITEEARENIIVRLDHVNNSDEETLRAQYEDKIKKDLEEDEKCAGLGFIYMALKSGNRIIYRFTPLSHGHLYFEIQITINKYKMRKLIIDPKPSSPKVILDPEKKVFLISGESRPPDVREFYGQILEWLDNFSTYLINSEEKEEPVIFNFNFEYFNSSSGKLILDICKILAALRLKGFNVSVNWHFEKEDDDMLEAGKEMSRIVKFPFEFVESGSN